MVTLNSRTEEFKAKQDKISKDFAVISDNYCKVLKVLLLAVVQDALELADEYPNNPVHALLLRNQKFMCAHLPPPPPLHTPHTLLACTPPHKYTH